MTNRTAYLAGPIDQDANHGRSTLKDQIVHHLNASNIAVYRPEMAWSVAGVTPTRELQDSNHDAISRCGMFVVVLPAGVATVGTIQELIYASQIGKPIALFTDLDTSWALKNIVADLEKPRFQQFPITFFDRTHRDSFDAWIEATLRPVVASKPKYNYHSPFPVPAFDGPNETKED